MPENINPFRETPPGLNPKDGPFFESFVPGYEAEPEAPEQPSVDQEVGQSDEQNDLRASDAEKEAYENGLIKCQNIEITRRQEKQLKAIVDNLNKERRQNGLEPLELDEVIDLYKITIGGKSKEWLEETLEATDMQITERADDILESSDFVVNEHAGQIVLMEISVEDFGFTTSPTLMQVLEKAHALGMALCPPETGPHFRLQLLNQQRGQVYKLRIGMKPILLHNNFPGVFRLEADHDGLWLHAESFPNTERIPDDVSFVFALPDASVKSEISQ